MNFPFIPFKQSFCHEISHLSLFNRGRYFCVQKFRDGDKIWDNHGQGIMKIKKKLFIKTLDFFRI